MISLSANLSTHLLVLTLFSALALSFNPALAQASDNKPETVDMDLPAIGDELEVLVPAESIERELLAQQQPQFSQKTNSSGNPDFDAFFSDQSISQDLEVRRNKGLYMSFVISRKIILQTLYRLMSPVTRDKHQLLNKLKDVDQSVQGSAEIIARKSRSGFFFTVSLSGGFGITKKILAKIKNERIARLTERIPQFYYLVGTGLALLKVTDSNQKQKIIVVLISDFDRLEKVHSFVSEVSVALNYGYGVEVDGVNKDNIHSHSVGILGTTKQSENHFSHNFTFGVALPPALPAWMVYSSQTRRHYFNLLQIPWFDKKEKLIRCDIVLL